MDDSLDITLSWEMRVICIVERDIISLGIQRGLHHLIANYLLLSHCSSPCDGGFLHNNSVTSLGWRSLVSPPLSI